MNVPHGEPHFAGHKTRHRWATSLAGLACVAGGLGVSMPAAAYAEDSTNASFSKVFGDTVKFSYKEPGYLDSKSLNPTREQREAQTIVENAMLNVVGDSDTLAGRFRAIPRGLQINLYDGAIPQEIPGGQSVGLAHANTWGQVLSNASIDYNAPTLVETSKHPQKGYLLAEHELTHILDFIDQVEDSGRGYDVVVANSDGMFPEWAADPALKQKFVTARRQAQQKIQANQSPLGANHADARYALQSDQEFLAVLSESYFSNAAALQEAHPVLFAMMDDYFDHRQSEALAAEESQKDDAQKTDAGNADKSATADSVSTPPEKHKDAVAFPGVPDLADIDQVYVVGGGLTVVTLIGGSVLLLRRKRQKAEESIQETLSHAPAEPSPWDDWGSPPRDEAPPNPFDW